MNTGLALRHLSVSLLAILTNVVLCSMAHTSVSLTDPIIIQPSNLDTQDLFGADMDSDGDTLVVLSKRYLYFYELNGSDNLNFLYSIAAEPSDSFYEVELENDILIVAINSYGPEVFEYNGKPSRTEVYIRDGAGNWQLETDTLPSANNLSFDGASLILGERTYPPSADENTWIYRRSASGQWELELDLAGIAGSLGIDNDLAVIASVGSTQIYLRAMDGEWNQEASISPGGQVCTWCAVSLHDESLLLGVIGQGTNDGSAYLYKRDSPGNWVVDHVFNGRVDASPGQENYVGVIGDKFGSGVRLFEDKAIVGAFDGNFSQLSGLLYVFDRRNDGTWSESHVLLSAYGYDGYPAGIAASDQYVVGGGIYTGAESGVAYAFRVDGASVDARQCVDTDGDGWGWDGIQSCVVSAVAGGCDYSDAYLYDGWGWNPVTSESCPPIVEQVSNCVDTDGDGWGWDGVQSCVVGEPDIETDCDYSDADIYDGWGWNPVTLESCPPIGG